MSSAKEKSRVHTPSVGLELGAVFLRGLPRTMFEEGLLCTIPGTVAILAQGTSWAVAVTQALRS